MLFAVGSIALVTIVGLVLMAGLLFWDQRQLQTLADGAALVGAQGITTQSCTNSNPITNADQFLAQQLGTPTSSLTVSGSCAGNYAGSATYTCGNTPCAVAYTYPWNSKPYEIGVRITHSGISG